MSYSSWEAPCELGMCPPSPPGVDLVDEQPQHLRRQLAVIGWWSRCYKNFDLESETLVTYIQVVFFLEGSPGTLSRSIKPLTVGTVQPAETPPLPPLMFHTL
jgi:hypothetical protein